MSDTDIVARLERHRTVGSAPREELAWLAAHGEMRHAKQGEYLTRTEDLLDKLLIVLSGHIAIYVDRGFGPRKAMEWGEGDVSGFLPFSRMGRPPGDALFDQDSELFVIPRDVFPELIRECPAVTTSLVHSMLDRVRRFTSSDLQDEKMMSLGRLSAGLAHELNNPASAAARSAGLLAAGLSELQEVSQALGALRLTEAQLTTVRQSSKACLAAAGALSPIERADREEAIGEWLEQHGADAGAAPALGDTDLALRDLDALASTLEGSALTTTLRWLAAACSTRALATEVERAASRIHDLVAAIKRHTYMDRTAAPEAVDLTIGLNDSVALLQHKARKKSAALKLIVEPGLPRVLAIGSDLNQVWMNLVDNALDAVPESGQVTVKAARNHEFVTVSVVDDGPGVPPELREKIFDAFFTTKPVGQGTGLGLDIAQRLVRRNDGDIELESRPGRTEFRVTLRVAPGADRS